MSKEKEIPYKKLTPSTLNNYRELSNQLTAMEKISNLLSQLEKNHKKITLEDLLIMFKNISNDLDPKNKILAEEQLQQFENFLSQIERCRKKIKSLDSKMNFIGIWASLSHMVRANLPFLLIMWILFSNKWTNFNINSYNSSDSLIMLILTTFFVISAARSSILSSKQIKDFLNKEITKVNFFKQAEIEGDRVLKVKAINNIISILKLTRISFWDVIDNERLSLLQEETSSDISDIIDLIREKSTQINNQTEIIVQLLSDINQWKMC